MASDIDRPSAARGAGRGGHGGARPPVRRRVLSPLAEFLRAESAGGVLLLMATVTAVTWANSPWSEAYSDLWHNRLQIGFGRYTITEDWQHWVNDALMAVFFFVIGLEIKRELVTGELRDRRAASLPVLAALGGMIVPALLYTVVAGGDEAGRGWGIAMATDIAFVLGVLAVLGRRAPAGLKLFLLTLAIIDDIGAILVIAVFYTSDVDLRWLAAAAASLAVVVAMKRLGVASPVAYLPVGVVVWICTYESGVHATIAGVIVGLLTPAHPIKGRMVLQELEHRLHPLTSFVVVPLFALANAGVTLGSSQVRDALNSRVTWGVIAGLVVGKTLGISLATFAGVRAGVGRLPAGMGPAHVVGGATLGGIGFTVSLFVTGLAFQDPALVEDAKLGILAGSLAAGVLGAAILVLARRGRRDPD